MIAAARPHVPVLLPRVVGLLSDAPDGVIVDVTLGAGGHAREIAAARVERYGQAHLVGLDRDASALDLAVGHIAEVDGARLDVARVRFDAFDEVLDGLDIAGVAGVFADLGISSMHIDRAERGFSHRHDGPLDMRMDPTTGMTAGDLVNTAERTELYRIVREHGEEKHAGRIVDGILAARPLHTTHELAQVVESAYPAAARRGRRSHPATQTFQALRIAVNGELDALDALLPAALARLAPGGVFAVLAYHSLEDRRVKRAFAAAATGCICPPDLPVCACGQTPLVTHVVRRPERPSNDEIRQNPRASAARLRAVRREG